MKKKKKKNRKAERNLREEEEETEKNGKMGCAWLPVCHTWKPLPFLDWLFAGGVRGAKHTHHSFLLHSLILSSTSSFLMFLCFSICHF